MELEQISALIGKDCCANANGMRLVEVRCGFARCELAVEPRHHNAVGIVQGGAIFTLADLAFAAASNSYGVLAVACQVDITFFKAVQAGTLTAAAEEIQRTRRLATYLIRVTDDSGEHLGGTARPVWIC
jgi:acyl-CoA thioesterase